MHAVQFVTVVRTYRSVHDVLVDLAPFCIKLTRDIDIAILSVCLSVRPSVRNVPVSDENGLTYCPSFFHHTAAQSL